MNWFTLAALAFVAAFPAIWLYILWRERREVTEPIQSVETKICLLIFAFMCVAGVGFSFSLIERDMVGIGATPATLLAATLVTFPLAWAIHQGLQRVDYPNPLQITILLSLILPVFNLGWIALLNGALDFRPAQIHRVRLLDLTAQRGRKAGWTYLLWVSDWNRGGRRVRIKTKRELYHASTIGDTLELKVGRGAFGIEWLHDARNLSR